MADNYTHFPYPDDFNENNQTLLNIRDILKEGSYLFYELEDCTIEVPLTAEISDSSYEEGLKNYWIEKSVDVAVKDGDSVTPYTVTISAKKREGDTDSDFTDGTIIVWKGDSLIDENLILNELDTSDDSNLGKFGFTPDSSVSFYTIRLYLQSEELDTELLYIIDKNSDDIVPILTKNSIHLAATPAGRVPYYGIAKSTIELYRNGEKILDGITYGPHSASLGCSLDTDTIRTEEVKVDRLSADSASVTLRATFEGKTYSQIFSIVRKKQSSQNSSKFYTKNISPLFYDRVMDNEENWDFLDIITEEIPFYHKEPNRIYDTERIILSATRDIGVTNVPSPLQDNDFYSSWFRDSIGYVKNSMILDIYNKMRYPYILENQYLNARILNNLANVLVKGITDSEARIALKSTDEENAEVYDKDYRFYGHEIGCLDYMEDVVEKKVNSIYSFIDFNPEYLGFLSDWVESSYMGGKMTYEESKEESLVYKLQDIRGELLRRKFAGTYSLYMLLLSSMGKTGSYLGVIPAGNSNTEAKPYYDEYGNILGFVKSFNDTRPLRVPNLPGLFTQFTEMKDYLNPISIYYDKPEDLYKIPLGTLIPLFYTSSDIDVINGEVLGESIKYNNELFYKTLEDNFIYYNDGSVEEADVHQDLGYVDPQSVLDYKLLGIDISKLTYRSNFYRDSANIILWDNMPGIMSQESVLNVPYTLDTIIEDTENPGIYRYRTLDETVLEDGRERYLTLDTSENRFDLSSVYGSVLDVTADDVLYHRNTLQKEGNYEFVTYPIANGNGLCLMDTSWLNYVEYYSKQKSKVNEDITFGVQISTYMQVDDLLSVPYEFFTYEIVGGSENPKKVRLYHNLLSYLAKDKDEGSEDDYKVISVKQTLMSVVSLKHAGNIQFYDSSNNLKSEFKEFEKFTKYNIGLLPITYKNLDNKVEDFQMGYDGGTSWNDDFSLQGLSEAYFVFSNYDIPNPGLNGTDPASMSDEPNFSDVKSVYFVVKRIEEGEVKFSWSDQIRLFNNDIISEFISSDSTKKSTFVPDWKGMVYYLNPYLNFIEESASPLRHKKVLRSRFLDETTYKYVEGPSEYTGLCNLTRMRHKDYLCNDTGLNDLEWINQNYKGLFLNRIQSDSSRDNNILIIGDNRKTDSNEVYYESIAEYPSKADIPTPYSSTVLYRIKDGSIVRYFKYNTVSSTLEEIFGFDPSNRFSDIYTNDFKVPSILYKEGTGKSSYFQLEHQNTLNGKPFTICLDLIFSKVPSGEVILLSQGENKILSYKNESFTFNGVSVSCEILTDINYRITICSGDSENDSYLIVNNEEPEKASSNIVLTSDPIKVCSVNFLGELLDFRVYNETKSLPNLRIINAGTFYEVYSYAPSNYKLAHTIYVDNSLIRMVDNTADNRTTYGIKDVSSIRVFNRSVWDSIMLDMYPVSLEEADQNSPQYYEYYKNPKDDSDIYDLNSDSKYLSNCIEQTLIEGLEVFNGRQVVSNTTLIHNNERHSISQASYVTAVLALIQPVDCKDESLTSRSALKLNNLGNLITMVSETTEDSEITIPMKADSSDDYFRYSADLNVNFKISPETNFSWFLARGTNIGLTYYNNINDVLTTLTDDGIKGSEKNYVLMPLCVPTQSSGAPDFYLDRLYVRNFSLARTLTNFLRATTYYTEIKLPVPCEVPNPGYVRIVFGLEPCPAHVGDNIFEWATIYNKGSVWRGVYRQGEYSYEEITSRSAVFMENQEYYYWDDNLTAPYYYNKWDAIRYLKEGEYIFTCKYPIKILPFSDDEYSSSYDYNTVYGTMRFKIVVSGTPKEMTDKEHLNNLTNLGNIPEGYFNYNIESTLKSSTNRVEPKDNKTFPHRLMNIELYAYDIKNVHGKSNIAGKMTTDGKEDYEYEWVRIASNDRDKAFTRTFESAAGTTFDASKAYYKEVTEPTVHYEEIPKSELSEDDIDDYFLLKDEIPTGITYLDSDALDNNAVITKRCSMFLSNNYTETFYVNNYDRAKESSITSGSNDDDLIDPIVVKSDIFSKNENLLSKKSSTVSSTDEDKINKIVLLAGKSYKLLFDFTSNVTEFKSVINNNGTVLTSDLITTLVAPEPTRYLYTESGEINSSKYTPSFSSSSFGTLVVNGGVNGGMGYCWDGETNSWILSGGNLGDPYSYNPSKNILAVFNENNKNIAESYQIRYLDKIMVKSLGNDGSSILKDITGSNIKRYYRFGEEVKYKAYNKNYSTVPMNFKESDIIKYHYDSLDISNMIAEVDSLDSIISGFSYLEPHFIGNSGQPVNNDISIEVDQDTLPNNISMDANSGKYRLCSRQSYPWYIPFKNNAYILRTGDVSNNLIQEDILKIVENGSHWKYNQVNMKYKKVIVPEGQNYISIFVRPQTTNGHIYLEYTKDECKINSVYTMEIWVRTPEGISIGTDDSSDVITARLYHSNEEMTSCELEVVANDTTSDGWKHYKGSTDKPVLADSIKYDICVSRGTTGELDYDSENNYINFKSAKVTRCKANRYQIGLSEIYNNGNSYDSSMIISSHTVPMFRRIYQNDTDTVVTFIPIQFKPEIILANKNYRPIPGIYRAASFISSCAVDTVSESSRIRYLKAPWIRRLNLYYRGNEIEVDFHKYGLKKDSMGTLNYKEVYSAINDIYSIGDASHIANVSLSEDRDKYLLRFTGGIKMNLADDGTIAIFNNNLKVNPNYTVSLVNERTSFTYNCFNLNKYRQGLDSYVGITNIQLLNKNLINPEGLFDDREVIYEIEYLPIIYNELKNHISFNIMFNHNPTRETIPSGEDTSSGDGESSDTPTP